jgi:hypothetical protein
MIQPSTCKKRFMGFYVEVIKKAHIPESYNFGEAMVFYVTGT